MRPTFALGAAALPFAAVTAFQFPFSLHLPFGQTHSSTPHTQTPVPLSLTNVVPPSTPRIAIVGAGAGGTASALWISKAKERFGINVEVDVYERNDYIGGRQC